MWLIAQLWKKNALKRKSAVLPLLLYYNRYQHYLYFVTFIVFFCSAISARVIVQPDPTYWRSNKQKLQHLFNFIDLKDSWIQINWTVATTISGKEPILSFSALWRGISFYLSVSTLVLLFIKFPWRLSRFLISIVSLNVPVL